jgi:ABC-2 type transport system permease protein
MTAYTTFELHRAVRNVRFLIFSVAVPVVLYLAIGQQKGYGDVDGVPFKKFFMVSMAAYGALIAALSVGGPRVAAERANGWVRQLRVTPLTERSYLVGKLVCSLLIVVPAIVLVAVVGQATGADLGVGALVQLLATLILASIPFALLGLAIGYWLDAEAAQAGTVAIMLGVSILGGLWFPINNFPRAVQYIGEALPSYRMASAARAALHGAAPAWGDVGLLVLWTMVFGLAFAYLYRRDSDRVRV